MKMSCGLYLSQDLRNKIIKAYEKETRASDHFKKLYYTKNNHELQ